MHTLSAMGVSNKTEEVGGLGFHTMRKLNPTSSAKLGWRLKVDPKCLWVRFLKFTYFRGWDLLHAENGALASNPSENWRGVIEYLPTLSIWTGHGGGHLKHVVLV